MQSIKYILALLFLSGCAASGPEYNEAHHSSGVIIYKPSSAIGMGAGLYEIDLNGKRQCKLHPGSYFVSDIVGDVTISSSSWDMPGTSKISFKAWPGKTYFVRMDTNDGKQIAATAGGLVGALSAEAFSSTGGPFIFTLVEPNQAKSELQGLKQDCL